MRWLNFMQRKAAPMAPIELVKPEPEPVRDPLAELQSEITLQQAKLAEMEAEARELGNHLGEIELLASTLKVRCSEHDAAAANQLDALEREQRSITRRREGLTLRIGSLQAELAPMVRQASELAVERNLARQDALVKEITVEKDRLIEEILQNWTDACESAFDLMTLLDGGMSGQQRLDDEHKRQVYSLNTDVGARLQAAALVHVNEQAAFQFARSEVFNRMKVIPAKRRESRRAAG